MTQYKCKYLKVACNNKKYIKLFDKFCRFKVQSRRNLNYIGQITNKLQYFERASPYRQNQNCARCNFLHKFLRGKTMKRKFKLITSVASLCLAVALMAFGVYAAANPTVTVTGSVAFSANNVYATVNAIGGKAADADSWTGASLGDEVRFIAGTSSPEKAAFAIVTETGDGKAANTAYLDDANTYYQYQLTIKSDFATDSAAKIKVNVSKVPAITDVTGVECKVSYKVVAADGTTEVKAATDVTTAGALDTQIAAGQTMTITVYVKVTPASAPASLAATDIGLTLDLTRA